MARTDTARHNYGPPPHWRPLQGIQEGKSRPLQNSPATEVPSKGTYVALPTFFYSLKSSLIVTLSMSHTAVFKVPSLCKTQGRLEYIIVLANSYPNKLLNTLISQAYTVWGLLLHERWTEWGQTPSIHPPLCGNLFLPNYLGVWARDLP